MIERFTNRYSLQKTLRFSLIPIGKTEEYFNARELLERDDQRAKDYKKVKEYIDRYFKSFIEGVLSDLTLGGLEECAILYNEGDKPKELEKKEDELRKAIADAFKNNKFSGNSKFITEELPKLLTEEEAEVARSFKGFTTYFGGFFTNRENLFSNEKKSTAIAYRCINENLPKFIDNIKSFEKVRASLPVENIDELNEAFSEIHGIKVDDIFALSFFSSALPQSGIEKYNEYIGGYSKQDGTKLKGLNEYINLYNQQVTKSDKSKRLPLMKPLYKQILSDTQSISFIPEEFVGDDELLKAVNDFYCDEENGAKVMIDKLSETVEEIDTYNTEGIYISTGANMSCLSAAVYSDWSFLKAKWNEEYENTHKVGKDREKFEKKREEEYNRIKSFSISRLQNLGGENGDICAYFKGEIVLKKKQIEQNYEKARALLTSKYDNEKKLRKNDEAVSKIKDFLDCIKDYERLVKMLVGTGKEAEKDNGFYGELMPVIENFATFDNLYNKVRNYLTKKPYSTDKIKLNFENPQLLGGWDVNKEKDYRCTLLKKGDKYYLAIMDKFDNKIFENAPISNDENYEKIIYKQISDVAKYFSIKQIRPQNPPENIQRYLEKDFDKKTMPKEQLTELIKYIAEDFIANYDKITDENGKCYFDFKIKDYSEYTSWGEFLDDLKPNAYAVKFINVSAGYIDKMINEGRLYLFQIYNKDFSEHSKGKPNLHTLYFKMLFDERNLKDVVYKLNGGAEMFYRYPSLKETETTIHYANEPLENKNPDNPKKHSTFAYKLIKDKRFTKPQFSLHVPIELNFKAGKQADINSEVRELLKAADKHHIIGIDRGERNLIYASVIDENGKIIMQKSFNIIETDQNYNVDYHAMLERREKARDDERKNWQTIENIKELKEGYISQVVHEICKLVVKYDAVIAMEDLNSGFINSRKKVDKQVYQKFENMLVAKLRFLADKSLSPEKSGGLLNAYQLTNPSGKSSSKQNGIVFYVPAWLTSKIDPVTGFVDLLNPKYRSVEASKELIGKIDDIRYNAKENYFEFWIDYGKFPKCDKAYRKQWTVCTNGERIKTYRNSVKNNEWDNKTLVLTDEFEKLFDRFEIDYSSDLKKQILNQTKKEFFEEFFKLLSLTLQMRNSITGNRDVDYMISPVKGPDGTFYDSRNYTSNDALPCDADANGAYNIARKVLWAINGLKHCDDLNKAKLSITNKEWLEYAQKS